jgi:hypothetical protein
MICKTEGESTAIIYEESDYEESIVSPGKREMILDGGGFAMVCSADGECKITTRSAGTGRYSE